MARAPYSWRKTKQGGKGIKIKFAVSFAIWSQRACSKIIQRTEMYGYTKGYILYIRELSTSFEHKQLLGGNVKERVEISLKCTIVFHICLEKKENIAQS